MQLRCKAGDLAIIVGEFPGCEENLGIIVKVIGPPKFHQGSQLICWRISPARRRKLWFADGSQVYKRFISKQKIGMHPDCWLLPISGNKPQTINEAKSFNNLPVRAAISKSVASLIA